MCIDRFRSSLNESRGMTSDRVNLPPRYFRDDVIVYYVIISARTRSPPRSPSSRHRRTRFTIRRIRTREFRLMIQCEAVRVQSRRASNERDVSGITIPINYVNTSGRRELHSITASPAARGFRASSRLIADEAVREIYIYIFFPSFRSSSVHPLSRSPARDRVPRELRRVARALSARCGVKLPRDTERVAKLR